ncbi:MAG: transporter [Methylotenera sp.]|nr:MAG: transporter [Methylotenera sp.]
MNILMAMLAGLVFGIGLIISGMTDPSKILSFLDFAGNWDPSLLLVMIGAVLVGTLAFSFAGMRTKSIFGDVIHMPIAKQIDTRLVLGSLTFGVGWGLAGYCPGPVIASIAVGGVKPLLFFIAMLAGMMLFQLYEVFKTKSASELV